MKIRQQLVEVIRLMPDFYGYRFERWARELHEPSIWGKDEFDGPCPVDKQSWPCDEWMRLSESMAARRERNPAIS